MAKFVPIVSQANDPTHTGAYGRGTFTVIQAKKDISIDSFVVSIATNSSGVPYGTSPAYVRLYWAKSTTSTTPAESSFSPIDYALDYSTGTRVAELEKTGVHRSYVVPFGSTIRLLQNEYLFVFVAAQDTANLDSRTGNNPGAGTGNSGYETVNEFYDFIRQSELNTVGTTAYPLIGNYYTEHSESDTTNVRATTHGFGIAGSSIKHLIEDGTEIKKWDNVNKAWVLVGASPVTDLMFTDHGMTDLTPITNTVIQSLTSATPKLLSQSPDTSSPQSKITAVPPAKVILANKDFDTSNIAGIDSASLTANASGSGDVKAIVSVDGGTSFKVWDGSLATPAWVTVDHTSPSAVKSKGMTSTVLGGLTRSQWDALTGTGSSKSNKLRFGYYLEQAASSDIANTDIISITVDMMGAWALAQPFTDFKYQYPRNDTMRVTILASGDYKINY